MLPVALDVFLGQPQVEEVNFMGELVASDTEVMRFDVSVEVVFVVDVLDSGDHLVDQHQYGFEGEPAEGLLEQCSEGRAHQIHHQHIVIPLFKKEVPSSAQ